MNLVLWFSLVFLIAVVFVIIVLGISYIKDDKKNKELYSSHQESSYFDKRAQQAREANELRALNAHNLMNRTGGK